MICPSVADAPSQGKIYMLRIFKITPWRLSTFDLHTNDPIVSNSRRKPLRLRYNTQTQNLSPSSRSLACQNCQANAEITHTRITLPNAGLGAASVPSFPSYTWSVPFPSPRQTLETPIITPCHAACRAIPSGAKNEQITPHIAPLHTIRFCVSEYFSKGYLVIV